MALDSNGIYLYDETENETTFSDLLNLGFDSASTQVGLLAGRATALEAGAAALGTWSSYTPTYGSGWTLGNATVVTRYVQVGKLVRVHNRITLGSTSSITNFNTGISIPVTASDAGWIVGSAEFFDTSTTSYYGGRVSSTASSTAVFATFGNGAPSAIRLSNTVPVASAAGDVLTLDFSYEAA